MSFSKQNSFDDRRQDSASAREAMLARFRARLAQAKQKEERDARYAARKAKIKLRR